MTRRILVVDDEPDMRLLLRLALRGGGYEIEEAGTGEEAAELEASGGFDLVLLDLNLPGISGMELLERWKGAGVVPSLAVLMLTADARPGLDSDAMDRGARALLTKPLPPADLIAEIERVLEDDPASPATVEGP